MTTMPDPLRTKQIESPRPVRLLICDDQALVRACVSRMLMGVPSITIIGEAAGGKAAVELALRLQPDAVLMDMSMPDLDGIEATRQILGEAPSIKIIAFSVESSPQTILKAMDAGACGYLLKTGIPSQIIEAIEKVTRGERFINVRDHNAPNWPRPD